MMEFKYTQNPEAETPIMFIDKEIGGKDENGEDNIQGNDFLKELMYLSDTLMKRNICVWINSPGGIVTEGQSIYTAILNCKANVDTYCYGIAASIAGVIFQAGKRRIMTSYANLMYHPAYSPDGVQDKALEALNKAICVMIAQRTGKTEDKVWAIMDAGKKDDKGTWMSADMAKEYGFCDIIDSAADKNTVSNRVNIANYYNKFLNKQTPKINPMNKILNKSLGLHEEASETAAVAVVEALNKSLGDLKKQVEDAKDALDKAKKELADFKAEKAKLDEEAKNKAEEEAKNKAKADEDTLNKKADEEMKNAIANGQIKNDAEVINSFRALLIKDFEGTKKVIDALPKNKVSATFSTDEVKDSEAEAAARKNGLKPGTAAWYNAIKSYNLKIK